MIEIKVKKLNEEVTMPTRATAGSSGYDVYSQEEYYLFPGQSIVVPLGFCVEVPDGYELQARSRSGLASKNQVFVTNSPGTIDSDYRGEVKVLLSRLPTVGPGEALLIKKGDRVAQLVLSQVPVSQMVEVTELSVSERDEGGFGSSGA